MPSFPYDTGVQPPAPMVRILVGGVSQPQDELEALVDTGSDISLLPKTFAEKLHLEEVGNIQVVGFLNEPITVPLLSAFVSLEGKDGALVKVATWERPFGLVGRNVINRWRVILDGPRLTTWVE